MCVKIKLKAVLQRKKILGKVSVIVNYNEINVNTVHCSTRVYAGGGCCF